MMSGANTRGADAAAARVDAGPQPMIPIVATVAVPMPDRGNLNFSVTQSGAGGLVLTSFGPVDCPANVLAHVKDLLSTQSVGSMLMCTTVRRQGWSQKQ